MQHLSLFARVQIHHARVVDLVTRAVCQQYLIGDAEYGGVEQRSMHGLELCEQRSETASRAAHGGIAARVGAREMRSKLFPDGRQFPLVEQPGDNGKTVFPNPVGNGRRTAVGTENVVHAWLLQE